MLMRFWSEISWMFLCMFLEVDYFRAKTCVLYTIYGSYKNKPCTYAKLNYLKKCFYFQNDMLQSDGAAEYTDCISAEG